MKTASRSLLCLVALAFVLSSAGAMADAPTIEVFKTPTCGCCTKWIDHLREAGFTVTAKDLPDVSAIKAANGVPAKLASCHTAIVEGYLVEGHVPAEDIRRLLRERPKVSGLAVPGMPIGSPGMEGHNPERYQVLSFGPEGVSVFATHGP